ncbi:RagB/SusD family nutrient uptake outer membrane protein [Olivibacter sp. XZL3]|uniref:RagB/SusD family nutrient uptake outer membrane protein n=1 Tax=Olivibacter sp. XZL3 TaxID=1735116 RepID=UPI001066A536|nr:RagB/SusD family nutrient uptake outer membrane protein [Olivibacter sp. XZL3]
MKQIISYIMLITLLLSFGSCSKKDEWLDVKSSKGFVVPETLNDFQALLDNSNVMNGNFSTPGLVGSDNLYIPDEILPTATETERNLYLWADEIWADGTSAEWNLMYAIVEYANLVLEGLDDLDEAQSEYANVKGQAYFFRAYAFYNITQAFCKAYDASTASLDQGIPLRLTTDVNIIVSRASLSDTFQQMLADAQEAAALLPDEQKYIQRPSKAAALALLAKIYLNMADYGQAEYYADQALSINDNLLDFNSDLVSENITYRFPAKGNGNPEVSFYADAIAYRSVRPLTSSYGIIDSSLYSSYEDNDLRKRFFYRIAEGYPKFIGGYSGTLANFCGIANNEVLLIRAEARARLGALELASADLDYLLEHRFAHGTYRPLTINTQQGLLEAILLERRKELPFTGNLRWEDLKRLNRETAFQKTLTRRVGDREYTLPPNDIRYVMPIPMQEIEQSGIHQNER